MSKRQVYRLSSTSLSDGGPVEFKASGSGKEFLDLASSYLYLKVKVSKVDGSNLDGASKVGFTNYPIASFFNHVDVILNGKLISSATNTYAHRIILEVLLNYDKKAVESQVVGFSAKIQLDKWKKWTFVLTLF